MKKNEKYSYIEKLKWKERTSLGVFVISVFSLLLISASLLSGTNLTGKVVSVYDDSLAEGSLGCSDSDGGKEYSVKGAVNYCDDGGGCFVKTDFCSEKKLYEYYCKNNEVLYEEYGCDDYCDDGACLSASSLDYRYRGGVGGGYYEPGSSSSSGTSSAVLVYGETHDLEELNSENTLEISKNDRIVFNIGGSEYFLTLQDFSQTEATMSVSGVSRTFIVGNDNEIDLNTDGTSDIYLKIRKIGVTSRKVTLTLNLL